MIRKSVGAGSGSRDLANGIRRAASVEKVFGVGGRKLVLGRLPSGIIVQSKVAAAWKTNSSQNVAPSVPTERSGTCTAKSVAAPGPDLLTKTAARPEGSAGTIRRTASAPLKPVLLPSNCPEPRPAVQKTASSVKFKLPAAGAGRQSAAHYQAVDLSVADVGTPCARAGAADTPSAGPRASAMPYARPGVYEALDDGTPIAAQSHPTPGRAVRGQENTVSRELVGLGPVRPSSEKKYRLSFAGEPGFDRLQSAIHAKAVTSGEVKAVVTPVRRSARHASHQKVMQRGAGEDAATPGSLLLLDDVEDIPPSLRQGTLFVPNRALDFDEED